MSTLPATVTIGGLGLMGGSLARALAQFDAPPHVTVVDPNPDVLRAALSAGVAAAAHTTLADAAPSDLLVLAAPVSVIVDVLRAGGEVLERHAVVTDVGSVKAGPLRAAAESGVIDHYTGSHPMCGDHRGGFGAARADLYTGSTIFVVEGGDAQARSVVTSLWKALGGHVVFIDADAHDTLVAHASHLPQLVSSLLGVTIAEAGIEPINMGPGGRDTTRIAASDARLWTDIVMHNRAALSQPLTMLDAHLQQLRRALEAGDVAEVYAMLARASRWRSGTS
jgi:prephenate dehydrogenase